jgi:hypothetical protein
MGYLRVEKVAQYPNFITYGPVGNLALGDRPDEN